MADDELEGKRRAREGADPFARFALVLPELQLAQQMRREANSGLFQFVLQALVSVGVEFLPPLGVETGFGGLFQVARQFDHQFVGLADAPEALHVVARVLLFAQHMAAQDSAVVGQAIEAAVQAEIGMVLEARFLDGVGQPQSLFPHRFDQPLHGRNRVGGGACRQGRGGNGLGAFG